MRGDVKPIYQAFDGQSRELVIPVYQRNYDWGEKQIYQLFDDLEQVIENGYRKHFFGAIVGDPETAFKWVVIDGQQRLTTVTLLILAIVHAVRDGDLDVDDPTLVGNLESSYILLGNSKYERKLKLKPVKNDQAAYGRLFQGEDSFDHESNVTRNYQLFRELLRTTKYTADQIWESIRQLDVMYLDLEKDDEPQRIFESLNSTGLALTEADKVRNFILMDLDTGDQEHLYEAFWNPIEKAVKNETAWFIRWYLVINTRSTPREADVYDAFKSFFQRSRKESESLLATKTRLLEEMLAYARRTGALTTATTGYKKIDDRLRRFNLIRGDVTLPFLLPVYRDLEDGTIDADDFLRIIKVIETYQLRRLVSSVASNSLNKIFATLYSELRRQRLNDESYSDIVIYLLRRRDDTSGRIPDDVEFRQSLTTRNIYHMRIGGSYLFDRLENGDSKDVVNVADGIRNGSLSIEHIMPRTLTSKWRTELGPKYKEIHDTWLNRLGNLTITGYNSEYSNASFEEKLNITGGFKDTNWALNSYIRHQTEWGEKQISERTQQLADRALELWPLPESNFEPAPVTLPSMPLGDEMDFTGKKLVAYEYQGVRQPVKSWKEFFSQLLRTTYRENEQLFREYFADSRNFRMRWTGKGSKPEESEIVPGIRIVDYVSTDSRTRFLRTFLPHMGIDTEDIILYFPAGTTFDEVQVQDQTDETGLYADITIFLPLIREIPEEAELADTAELRQGFVDAFKPFESENAFAKLNGRLVNDVMVPNSIGQEDIQTILATITLKIQQDQQFNPRALHESVIDGSLAEALETLQEAPEEPLRAN